VQVHKFQKEMRMLVQNPLARNVAVETEAESRNAATQKQLDALVAAVKALPDGAQVLMKAAEAADQPDEPDAGTETPAHGTETRRHRRATETGMPEARRRLRAAPSRLVEHRRHRSTLTAWTATQRRRRRLRPRSGLLTCVSRQRRNPGSYQAYSSCSETQAELSTRWPRHPGRKRTATCLRPTR
jgi:hypothetical protein